MRSLRYIATGLFIISASGFFAKATGQTSTHCQTWLNGSVTCSTSAPPEARPDPFKQLNDILKDMNAEKAAKRQRDAEAAYRASQLEQQQELIRLQREAAEAERERIATIQQRQAYAQSQQEADRQAEQLLRTQVSTAVLEGRCEDAKTIALLASRIDMAEQAMRLCQPRVVEVAPRPKVSSKRTQGVAGKGKGVKSLAAPQSPPPVTPTKQTKPIINTPIELPFGETLILAIKELRINCALALKAVRETGNQAQEKRVQQFCDGY